MIRAFNLESQTDLALVRSIHAANELPENCLPQLKFENGEKNPVFLINGVYEHEGIPALMVFLKVTNELFLLIDHTVGTPDERWAWLCEMTEWMKREAYLKGFDQLSAFLPPEIEEFFGKRML